MKSIVYNIKELGSISSINLKKRETTTLLVILQILKLCILILSFLTVLWRRRRKWSGREAFLCDKIFRGKLRYSRHIEREHPLTPTTTIQTRKRAMMMNLQVQILCHSIVKILIFMLNQILCNRKKVKHWIARQTIAPKQI